MRIFRNLKFIAIALVVVTLVGMTGFHYIEVRSGAGGTQRGA